MKASPKQFITNAQGKKVAVLVPIRQYDRLIEDLHDLAVAAERREEEPVSLAEMKKRLRRDGGL